MANQVYQELMRHYFSLQSEHKECMEQLTTLKARCKQINYQMAQVDAILSEFGDHIYEHFEEKQTWSEAFINDCQVMGGEYEEKQTASENVSKEK